MSRKRSIASLLDDLDEESPSIQSSSVAHSRRNRSITSIVNEETASSSRPSSNIRKKVICNCPDCNGKLVDSRTKELHEFTYQEYQGSQSPIWPDIQQLEISEGSASPRRLLEPIEHDEPIEQDSDNDHQSGESAGQPSKPIERNEQNSDDDDYYIDDAFLFRRRTRRYTTRPEISGGGSDGDDGDDDDCDGYDSDEDKSSEYSESFEFTTEEDIYSDNSLGDKSDDYDNYDDYDEISKIFEDYSAPNYEPFQPFQPPLNSNQFL